MSRCHRATLLFNSIFNSVYFVEPNITNYKFASVGLYNLYTYDIPVPGPHIGSGKTPKKIEKKTIHKEKREEPFRRATEEDPSIRTSDTQMQVQYSVPFSSVLYIWTISVSLATKCSTMLVDNVVHLAFCPENEKYCGFLAAFYFFESYKSKQKQQIKTQIKSWKMLTGDLERCVFVLRGCVCASDSESWDPSWTYKRLTPLQGRLFTTISSRK